MIKYKLRLLLAFTLCLSCSAAVLSSAQLPVEARDSDGVSEEDEEVISTSYVLPNQIFNGGKPYYASKDPISGQFDFNVKKSANIDAAANEVIDSNEKAIISSSSPNIHDFLNLPVKYSSSKFVYPLVSSSYANLKYQGSNKNYITNKKPTQVVQATSAPNHYTANYYTIPTTKLIPIEPTAPGLFGTSSSTSTTSPTTKKPAAASTSTSTSTTSTSTSTTTSTTKVPLPQTSISVQSSSSSQKYTTSSRKPNYSTTTPAPKTSTTRKKFVPTKKYSPTTPVSTSTAMRFPDQAPFNTTAAPTPTTTTLFTTRQPTPPAAIFPTDPSTTKYYTSPSTSTTGEPIVFTEDPTAPPPFSPFPVSTRIPNLDPADVYHTLDQKNTENKFEQKPSMTLADIFNSLADEESAVAANNPMHHGLDAQGNLMEPLDPSKPSPFAKHQDGFKSIIPLHSQQQQQTQSQQQPEQPQHPQQQQQQPSVISSSPESFSNEYVSYKVQQPNIQQYRPVPGAINNVVISPGQHSASFVLGSQQKVGQNAFGSIEKEPLFSKEHPVQYGTVINEDISTLNRQPAAQPPSASTTYQEMPSLPPTSNFHQNGNFASEPKRPEQQRPLTQNNYQELPPAPPSPYQQLPLVGNIRNKPNNPPHQHPLSPPQPPQQSLTSPNAVGSVQSVNPQENLDNSITLGSNQDTKELLVSTNIRFPTNEEHSAEVSSLSVANGPPAGPQVNGHAQPVSLQQIQNSNSIVFPKQEEGKPQQNEINYHSTPVTNAEAGVQIQQHEVLTMNQHQQKLNFPSSNEPNTPAQHMVPPPRFPPPLSNSIGNDHELQKPSRPHGGPQQYAYNEYTRKPIPGITRPNPDRHLPNILPQFRPNAKLSSGHPQQTNFNQEPGNIRVTGPQQPNRGPNTGNPQFSHRRQPLGGQQRYPLTRMADYPNGLPPPNEMVNRRVFRVPPYGGPQMQYLDRPGMHQRRPPMSHSLRPAESMTVERHALAPTLEKLPAFEEEDLVINDPPQHVTPSKGGNFFSEAKLEPVVTLQMLQSQKKAVSLPSEDSGDGEIQVPSLDNDNESEGSDDNQNGLYVVYPMKGGKKPDALEGVEAQNALPAVAHIEPPTGSEYQNTPFSIIRDQQQEPVLKNKKPLSLQQQQNKAQPTKDSFPYAIEKPDPSYSELNSAASMPGIVIAPKIMNGAYGLATEAPIAIAYTPTESSRYQGQGQQQHVYSNINLATPVIKEIRPDSQTEEVLNGHDFDLRAQNYEKNFMAPFYPSVSLDSVTSTPSNGWNVLPSSSTDKNLYEKNNIDRSDNNNDENNNNKNEEAGDSTTKSFELDKFQPELQGGFKPIYPPGYKLDNEEEEQQQLAKHKSNNLPLALASRMEPPQKMQLLSKDAATSSTTSSTTTTTAKPLKENSETEESTSIKPKDSPAAATTKPTKRTKSKFETSLAALLFGEDEEEVEVDEPVEEPKAHKEPTKAMMSGPRSIPRMGPRNMKI